MPDIIVHKEILNGEVRLSAGNCTFVFRRPGPGFLHVVITGLDNGQFGTTTLDEIRAEIGRDKPIELFVDAREAVGAQPHPDLFRAGTLRGRLGPRPQAEDGLAAGIHPGKYPRIRVLPAPAESYNQGR